MSRFSKDAMPPFNMTEEDAEVLINRMDEFKMLQTYYKCAIMEIETKFNVLNEQFAAEQSYNPIESIESRLKSYESIVEKLNRKGLPVDPNAIEQNLNDVAGIRVICPFVSDIYLLADCLLKQDDITLIKRKDYIVNPKENGYRSLHLIVEVPIFLRNERRPVRVEVQLRTIAMNFWSSIEHRLRYKKNIDPALAAQLYGELKDCAEQSASLDERMGGIKDLLNKKNRTPQPPRQS